MNEVIIDKWLYILHPILLYFENDILIDWWVSYEKLLENWGKKLLLKKKS